MRKQIVASALALISFTAVAQKKELRAAEKALDKKDFNTALSTIKSLESSIADAKDKYKAKYYFIKGQALAGKKNYMEASKIFRELINFEKEIGSNKYTSKTQPKIQLILQEVSEKAVDLYNNKKDYKAAAENFYLTYLLSPKDTGFAFNAAVSATQAKEYDMALKYYKELKDIGYDGSEKKYLGKSKASGKMISFKTKKDRDTQIKLGLVSEPKDIVSESKKAVIVKNIALILAQQGKTDEAIKAIKEARKANPKDVNLILNEADLYVKLNKMDKFAELMKEAVALDPNNPNLYYNLGVINFNEGKAEEARNYYKKAIELKPDYGDAYMNLAVAILDKEKPIVEEMNKNLSNFKKFDQLAAKQKEVYKEALPYLEKADGINRSLETVKTLKNIYEVLEMASKAAEYNTLYQSMR